MTPTLSTFETGALLTMSALPNRMIEAFEDPQLNSFSCTSPLNLNA